MTTSQTIENLLQNGALTENEVRTGVEAWFAAPSTARVAIGAYEVTVGTVLRQNKFLAKTMRDPEASEGLKKAALRKVLLKGRPEKQ